MGILTFDLWNTLVYLTRREEIALQRARQALAVDALSHGQSGAVRGSAQFQQDAEQAYIASGRRAQRAASKGVSISPIEQLRSAGRMIGHEPATEDFLEGLSQLLLVTPFHLAPHTAETLSSLADRGFRLGIVSNTIDEPGRFLIPVCQKLGIASFFDAFTFSDELPWSKPSPMIFREAYSRLGAKPPGGIHVGDAVADIVGARAAGYRHTVLFAGINRLHSLGETIHGLVRGQESGTGEQDLERIDALLRRRAGVFKDQLERRVRPDFIVRSIDELVPLVDRLHAL